MSWRDEFLPASLREFVEALASILLFGLLMSAAFVARAFEPEIAAFRDALLAAVWGL